MTSKIIKVSSDKHDGDITCFTTYNGFLFSAGADGKIKIWDNDLNCKKTIEAHETYIYAMVITSNGTLYSSCAYGTIKLLKDPINSSDSIVILKCDDTIVSLALDGDILYSGDDKGVVTLWINNKIIFKYNLVEEIRSLCASNSTLYTACDKDVVVTTIDENHVKGSYMTRATIPGKSPICLLGPMENNLEKWIAYPTRDGKGLNLTKNCMSEKFPTVWTVENIHEMIINAVSGNSNTIFTGGWDGKVKKWNSIETKPVLTGEADTGNCINAIEINTTDDTVFIGGSDGKIRKIAFNL